MRSVPGRWVDDVTVPDDGNRSGAVPEAALCVPDGRWICRDRPGRVRETTDRDAECAGLRHHRSGRSRNHFGADLAPRGVVAPGGSARRSSAPWRYVNDPLVVRSGVQTFGIVDMGRIATAVALRGKAFNFRVMIYDLYLPNGAELGLGVLRTRTLEELLRQTDTLSMHTPLTPETRGMLGLKELSMLPKGSVVVNTARGLIVDIDAVATLLKSGHLAGVGLDVLPVEPPVEPLPELLRAYRAREPWTTGRLVITPHSAFYAPQAWDDIRSKGVEMMAVALMGKPQNMIAPESY